MEKKNQEASQTEENEFPSQKTKKPATEGWLFHLVKEFLPGSLFG